MCAGRRGPAPRAPRRARTAWAAARGRRPRCPAGCRARARGRRWRGAAPGRRRARPCGRGRGSARGRGNRRRAPRRGTAPSAARDAPNSPARARLRLAQQLGPDELVEVAVEHGVDVADLVAGAQVLDDLVRVQDVVADLRAEVDVLRLALLARDLLLALALQLLGQLRAPHPHRRLAVLRLRALVLALHNDAGRAVRDAHGRVGLVDVLAAGARRAVGVDLQVVGVDLDVAGIFDDGGDLDAGEARLAAVRGVERAEA